MDQPGARHYRFEGFTLDTRARELKAADGALVPLNARAFDALCLLLRHRDRVVGKDELLEQVWAGRVVEENTLTQAISGLRRALGASAGDHRFIVTVPGRGYRFVADASEDDPAGPRLRRSGDLGPAVDAAGAPVATPAAALPTPPPAAGARPQRRGWWLLGLACLLAALGWTGWRRDPPPPPPATAAAPRAPATLAVLPFRSLSGGARDEGLELGLAETLITRLAGSPSLQVPALASAQRLPAAMSAQEAGSQLGAAYVVEGSTQRSGEQVRVNARLLSVATGKVLWGGTFDASMGRVFTLQDEIGAAVTSALALAPPPATTGIRSPCEGADALAYRAYLRGQYQLNRPTAARMNEALAAFREAIDRDPACARAWAGTAFAYRALVMTGDRDPNELFPLAKAAVARALQIDPASAEAYTSKGFIEFWYDWDWPRAEASLRHAIALNPNLAEAHMAMAHLLANIGRAPEAVPYVRRAVALDPLSPLVNALGGAFMLVAGNRQEGQAMLQKTLEIEPDTWHALRVTSARAQAAGDKARAIADMRRAVEISDRHSNTLAALGVLYAHYGDRAAAQRVLDELEARRRAGYLPATSLALMTEALGDGERTLALLEEGYRDRDVRMTFVLRDWPGLAGEPRFRALLERMRLPDPPPGRASQAAPR